MGRRPRRCFVPGEAITAPVAVGACGVTARAGHCDLRECWAVHRAVGQPGQNGSSSFIFSRPFHCMLLVQDCIAVFLEFHLGTGQEEAAPPREKHFPHCSLISHCYANPARFLRCPVVLAMVLLRKA